MPASVSGGRLMAGMTEVRAVLAAAAVFRCSCCTSDLAAAASSRSLMTRYRRTRANALRTRSVAYRRIIAATAAAMSRKVMVFRRSVEWIRGSGSGGVDQGQFQGMRAGPVEADPVRRGATFLGPAARAFWTRAQASRTAAGAEPTASCPPGYLHDHVHRAAGRAVVDALERRHIGIVPAPGNDDVALADRGLVGRVGGHPFPGPVLHPGMALPGHCVPEFRLRGRVQVPGDVTGRQAYLPQQGHREMGDVLADTLPLVPRLLSAGLHLRRSRHVLDRVLYPGGDVGGCPQRIRARGALPGRSGKRRIEGSARGWRQVLQKAPAFGDLAQPGPAERGRRCGR